MRNYGVNDSKDIHNEVILKKVSISGNLCGEFAEFSISQVYMNNGANDIDAVYTFPIPDTAVITGFEAILGGRTLKAVVEEKKEAIRIYEEAQERGINTFSLEQFTENVFQFAIGKILANETVKIKISYMDQLEYEDGAMKLVIPTAIGARYVEEEQNSESTMEDNKNRYKLSLNLLVESLTKTEFTSPTHEILVEREEDTLAKVTFPNQYFTLDKDFELYLREEKELEASGMIYEYVEKEEEKGILYLRLRPELESEEEGEAKNYIFLIDISESMEGDKLNGAKNALQLCLRNLSVGDSFNIVAIESELHYFSQVRRVPFSEDSLRKASEWIDDLKIAYGADIFGALKYALSDNQSGDFSTVLLFTDDQVEDEGPILEYAKENIRENRIFTFGIDSYANCYFINKLAEIGYGKAEFIYAGERIDDVVLRQFKRITNPQVDILEMDWGKMKVETTYPRTIDYLYDREPLSIFAKVSGAVEGEITVKGKVGNEPYVQKINLDNLDLEENAKLIEKIWSRKRIESITEKLKGQRGPVADSMRNKIIEISKESGIISKETTFVFQEQIEEPLLGMPLVHHIPLKISEQTLSNIAEGYFLEASSFLYKASHKNKAKQDREIEIQKDVNDKYSREEILRILARKQCADGSFVEYEEKPIEWKLENTLFTLIAFVIGKENISLYINQINKSIEFIIKTLESDVNTMDKKLYTLTAIALKATYEKGILKGKQKEQVDDKMKALRILLAVQEYEQVLQVLNIERASMKDIVLSTVETERMLLEKEVVEREEKSSILAFAKLAILKAL